jgi:hypothetical protein
MNELLIYYGIFPFQPQKSDLQALGSSISTVYINICEVAELCH